MLKKNYTTKVFFNSKNSQYSISLSKKKLKIPKDKKIKEIDIEIKNVKWW